MGPESEWENENRITDELSVFAVGESRRVCCVVQSAGIEDLILIVLSPTTAAALTLAFATGQLPWKNSDGSMEISQMGAELNIIFNLAGPPWRASLTLDADRSRLFRAVIAAD